MDKKISFVPEAKTVRSSDRLELLVQIGMRPGRTRKTLGYGRPAGTARRQATGSRRS